MSPRPHLTKRPPDGAPVAVVGAVVGAVVTVVAALAGGAGIDAAYAATRSCDGRPATIVGTDGDDTITGTDGDDVIVAGPGNDVVRAGKGDDVVCGNQGSDLLVGGAGDDQVFGQMDGIGHDHSSEVLYGDTLHGGPGDDHLDVGVDERDYSNDGDEVSWAGSRNAIHLDLSLGTATGEGHDTLVERADTELVGTKHDDVLLGSDHGDAIEGGPGNDTIDGRGSGDQLYAEYAAYDIDAPPPFEDPARGGPQPYDEDVVNGGDGGDHIVSRSGADLVHGGDGDDEILPLGRAQLAQSRFYGDAGDDDLYGPLSDQSGFVVDAGPGDDRLSLAGPDSSSSGPVPHASLDLSVGTLTIRRSTGTASGLAAGAEHVFLGEGAVWSVIGSAGADEVYAHDTTQPLHASMRAGNDLVEGTRYDDDINAGPGDDTVDADGGFDTCTNVEHRTSCESP